LIAFPSYGLYLAARLPKMELVVKDDHSYFKNRVADKRFTRKPFDFAYEKYIISYFLSAPTA